MASKAQIVSAVDDYHYIIRIPSVHKAENSPGSTPNNELPIAKISTSVGISPTFRKGNIVIIDDESDPVIIGVLFNDLSSEIESDGKFCSLEVKHSCKLSKETSIGNVSSESLSYLEGLEDNLPEKLKEIQRSLKSLYESINVLKISTKKRNDNKEDLTEIYRKIDEILFSIEDLRNQLKTIVDDVETLSDYIEKMTETISATNKELSNLKTEISKKLENPIILNSSSYGSNLPSSSKVGQVYFLLQEN